MAVNLYPAVGQSARRVLQFCFAWVKFLIMCVCVISSCGWVKFINLSSIQPCWKIMENPTSAWTSSLTIFAKLDPTCRVCRVQNAAKKTQRMYHNFIAAHRDRSTPFRRKSYASPNGCDQCRLTSPLRHHPCTKQGTAMKRSCETLPTEAGSSV